MKTIFQAGFQLTKVRGVMWFSLACAAGSIWAGINLAQSYGLSPADGGVLAPLPVRLTWGVGVSLLGIIFLVGTWVYGRCYVGRIEFDEQTGAFCVYTLQFPLGTQKHAFDESPVLSSRYHEGKLDTGEMSVDAPWRTLRIKNRRLPLIIDGQGVVLDEELMREFIKLRET